MPAVPYSDLPAGVVIAMIKDPVTGWPARLSSRADLVGLWIGPSPQPGLVSSGTGGMINNVDEWFERPFPPS